ncbi:MAG TPA: DUF1028 domain-containing protein [Gemmatimonadales bacterium]|nr:DUF1028 domain-containing protein [Gemmatimonadales bacterium]
MMRSLVLAAVLAAGATPLAAQGISDRRPVATYSIVARDSVTGEIGVAVQSHWFSVGSIVVWAEAGVGAVATQSFIDPSYGPLGLSLMRVGRSAPDALRGLIASDPDSAVRQVAMVDARGRVAAFTGARAIVEAGHVVGSGFSVQANLMEKATVWPAMARAFETGKGDLAERLLLALEAAEREGGDIRGRQSAAILVVAPAGTGRPWADRLVDLRVEDHSQPVAELRRLVTLSRLYRRMNEGDEWVTKNDIPKAVEAYNAAIAFLPDSATNGEAVFWTGISLAAAGREQEAMPYLVRAYAAHPKWADLVGRLPPAGLLPRDPALVERLVQGMQAGRR